MGFWDIAKSTMKVIADISGQISEKHKEELEKFAKKSENELIDIVLNGNNVKATYAIKTLRSRNYPEELIEELKEARDIS